MNEITQPAEGNQQSNASFTKENVPNATAVLVMGILSIIFCWCWGVIGLILGIIGLILGSKSKKLYKQEPARYTEASFKNLNAGYICSLIGTILSGLWIAIVLISVVFGLALGTNMMEYIPWENFEF